ncbi:unnamed protein product [Paramecium sonneborni]|uniref:Uncharacterized protein n=1 Tax=Paramecium sonneborni TaxID=65129 RepID=A0A8S1RAK5_9CILI|nr:unnamed protein product [Paramecium sonneborni]
MELKKGEKVKYIKDGEIRKIESINDMMKELRYRVELIAGGICNYYNNKIGIYRNILEKIKSILQRIIFDGIKL